ncbi:hypothetical protein [Methanobacterium formicicum]|uniref:5'-methylthioadenosine/S-adenosylhomocysteine nucleosidase family protein n=1 Tax=Methanobacterium formicicum TaxID=2162 RepID=UPI002490CCFA|nr:hypothetical protein [Methanobacterium formicicum]
MLYEECEILANKYANFKDIIEKIDKKLSTMDSSSTFDIVDVARFFKEEISVISIIFEKLYQLDLLQKEIYYICPCENKFDFEEVQQSLSLGDSIECSNCGSEINDQNEIIPVYRLKQDKVLKIREKDSENESDKTKFQELDKILIGVVVALDIELDAVLNQFSHRKFKQDSRTYYVGHIDSKIESYNIAVTRSSHPGNTPSAIVTKDLINDLNPKYIILIGIAAGYGDDGLKLGDVVVSDAIFDYDYTKEFDDKSLIRPRTYNSDHYLMECVKNFEWDCEIEVDCPDGSSSPNVIVGHIATGNKVIASKYYKEKIKSIHDKIIAIEMESGGVADAAKQLKNPIGILVIKGISDLGDEDKDDDWHEYSANAAAQFFADILRSGSI